MTAQVVHTHDALNQTQVLVMEESFAPGERGIRPGLYQHYKGGVYEVLNIEAYSEANDQKLVLYRAFNERNQAAQKIWARPEIEFLSTLGIESLDAPSKNSVKGQLTFRFQRAFVCGPAYAH